jgi:hypothetical protein
MNPKALRKHATSIVLLAAAAALGAYVFVFDRDRPTTDEVEARKDNLLPLMRRNQITEITIEQGGKKARIVRVGDVDAGDDMFHLVAGDPARDDLADQIAVEQLTQALEFATRQRKVGPDFDRAITGLDQPAIRLTLSMGKITYRIAVGNESKTPPGARFVQLDDRDVFVVQKQFADEMARPIDTYRTHTILPYMSSQVSSIIIESGGQTRTFTREPWGFRVGTGPSAPRASRVAFSRLLNALANLSAERFVDLARAEAALGEASQRVTLTLLPAKKGDPKGLLEIGGQCPNERSTEDGGSSTATRLVTVIRRQPEPIAACAPETVLADLLVPAEAYRDRKLLDVREDEVEQLTLLRGERTLELLRKGSAWHARKPSDQDLAAEDVDGFITALVSMQGEIVALDDPKSLGLDPPSGMLRIVKPSVDGKNEPVEVVDLSDERTEGDDMVMYARRQQDGAVLRLSRDQARLLQPTTTLFRSTQILDVSPQGLRRVEITQHGGASQILERKGAAFDLVEPSGYPPDAPLASDLFGVLAKLKGERWVADSDDGTFGFSAPFVRVRLKLEADGGSDERELLLGGVAPDGRYARWNPDSGVFVVARALETALQTYAIDRATFMLSAQEINTLRLVSTDRDVRIGSASGVWTTLQGSKPALPEGAVAKIRQVLVEMRADGVVHLGAPSPDEGFDKPIVRIEIELAPSAARKSSNSVRIDIGRADVWHNTNVHFARKKGVDATFAIAAAEVRPLLDLLVSP